MSRSKGGGYAKNRSNSASRGYSSASGGRRPPASYARAGSADPRRHTTVTKETIIIREAPRTGQPGLFRQAAATAGGVAVGTAVGSVVGDAITGGSRRTEGHTQSAHSGPTSASAGPCDWEIQQFLECARSHDVTQCEGFNEAIKECKRKHGVN